MSTDAASNHTTEGQRSVATDNAERAYRPAGEIRTFALRQARMSPAQRRDYDRLLGAYGVAFQPVTSDLRALFPFPERPLVMEIGFGMGESTAQIAATMPQTNYLGVEVYRPGVGKLLGRIEAAELSNVRIINHDAVAVLAQMTPDAGLDGVHIFFPDPWPKKKHHKRRLIQPDFVRLLRPKVKPGGYVYLVTDWRDYAEQMLEVFFAAEGFTNPHDGFAPRQPWRPETSFERKGLRREHTIHDLWVVRSA
ncbi:MAG: tRNA (guanosine(46)-N7)-methyltransferase TrmB [Spirochaetaceae bacterium]|nr:MAG: tRNA (guanosine(46)-N7)-methyltransferase TrmB [Spirochaetaceae bacterium]